MKFTLIFRVAAVPGQLPMPLAASMDDEKDVHGDLEVFKGQAKKIMRQTSTSSPTPCTIEAGAYSFHYLICEAPSSPGVKICFLTLAEKSYSRRFAFDYLDDLQREFIQLHGQQIDSVERPYKFITFDTFIQKTKKMYMDTRGIKTQMKLMSEDLRDITGIMTKNIQEVLGRGEKLETVSARSGELSAGTKRFKDNARALYRELLIRQWAPVVVVVLIVIFLLYLFWR